MILFKNEYTSDKDAYIALTKAFFISLSPVRAALNYILSAALIGFGIYNLIIAQYTWGVVMTACGALLVLLTAGYPFLMAARYINTRPITSRLTCGWSSKRIRSGARTARTTMNTRT